MIKLGDTVPLHLQLYDGNDKMIVHVEVLSPMQDNLFSGELLHVANGLYETLQFKMPAVDYVVCTYIVYDKKGEESDGYARSSDIFYRDIIGLEMRESFSELEASIFDQLQNVVKRIEDIATDEIAYVGNEISEVPDGPLQGVEMP